MALEPDHMRQRLEVLFNEIETTRMDGVPILNRALSVAAFGFEPWRDYHLGVLLTPWFMNLMLVPLDAGKYAENPPQAGDKQMIAIPAGQVQFIVGYEASLGYSLSCSLFSPVLQFKDQQAAVDTAKAALKEILNADCEPQEDEADMREIWAGRLPEPEGEAVDPGPEGAELATGQRSPPRDVNRRNFLRGGSARDQAQPGDVA